MERKLDADRGKDLLTTNVKLVGFYKKLQHTKSNLGVVLKYKPHNVRKENTAGSKGEKTRPLGSEHRKRTGHVVTAIVNTAAAWGLVTLQRQTHWYANLERHGNLRTDWTALLPAILPIPPPPTVTPWKRYWREIAVAAQLVGRYGKLRETASAGAGPLLMIVDCGWYFWTRIITSEI